jgi:hypothetical protein
MEDARAGAGSGRRFAAADHINRCWTYVSWTTARWCATKRNVASRSHLRDAQGQRRCNSHFRTGQRESTAALLVLAAQRAHSKLQAASRACLTAARQPPRLTKDSEGARCGWRAAVQFGAAQLGGSAAVTMFQRIGGLSACEGS